MKLRLILMGCILSVLAGILLIRRGYSLALAGLLAVGIALLVVGLIWKQSKNTDSIHRDTV